MTETAKRQIALSIVIVSFNAPKVLDACILSIAEQVDIDRPDFLLKEKSPDGKPIPVEVILVRADGTDHLGRMDRELVELQVIFHRLRWIDAPKNTTVPQLRAIGAHAANGNVVAMLEDDCLIGPNWCKNIIAAHESGATAVSASMRPGGYKRGLDWAVFFCDYAKFMPPFEGDVSVLPGSNMSYGYSTLDELAETGTTDGAFYEVFVNSKLLQEGKRLYAAPDTFVINVNSWTTCAATTVPFHHGRGYAGMRFRNDDIKNRLIYAGACVILPFLQTVRICKQVQARQQYNSAMWRALPWIFIYMICWSFGEFVGYLLGPGDSLQHWR